MHNQLLLYVMFQTYVHITVKKEDRLMPLTLPDRIKVEPLSLSALYDAFNDPKCLWRLFPHGMVVVGREPMKVHRDNYNLITSECKQVMTSRDVTTGEIQTISFGTGYHSPQGYVYEVDIYTGTGNAQELAQHVLEHIPVARRQMTNENTLKMSVFVIQKHGVSGLMAVLQGTHYSDMFEFSRVSHHTLGSCQMGLYYDNIGATMDTQSAKSML